MPIDFTLPPELELLRRTVRRFVENEILPNLEYYDAREEVPREDVEKMAKLGLMGVPIPREYGGAGLGELGYAIVLEELGRISTSHATIVGAHCGITAVPIWLFGTEEQRKKYLPKMARGEWIGAHALTEPNAGSDVASLQTTAVKKGNEYILNGSKIFISNGDIADIYLVFATTNRALGPAGMVALIVERDMPGITVISKHEKMGIRASSQAELSFDNVRVPEENVLGKVGQGMIVALTALDGGRVTLAAGSVGATQGLLDTMIFYAKHTRRLGKSLKEDELAMWAIAETAAELEAARYLVYHSVVMVDKYYKMLAARKPVPRSFREKVTRMSAMSKFFASEVATRAADRALKLIGEPSIIRGLALERLYRDSIIAEIYEGTNEIQRYVVARDLLR